MVPSPMRWVAVAAALVAGTALASCSYQLPALEDTAATQAQSSVILASDGSVVTTVHGPVDRQPVTLAQMAPSLRQAVVAIEDQRFWTEPAIDLRAILRAVVADVRSGGAAQGGSTIAEQYVKNELASDPGKRDLAAKVREATLAYQLERHASRSHVLELYLNSVYFGNGAYGVQAAAITYFGKPASALDLAQSALLAGVIHAPTDTDPYQHPQAALSRRAEVLHRMVALAEISPSQAGAAGAEPLVSRPQPQAPSYPGAYFVADVERFVLGDPRFGSTPAARRRALFEGGLRISTTLDLARQAEADAAVRHVLPQSADQPDGALASLDPRTGAVVALVGGRGFFSADPTAQLDLATQSNRQSGSTFKPFVLATALEQGIPLSRTFDGPSSINIPVAGGTWHVRNYEGEPVGRMDLVRATVVSDNTVYAQLMMQVGPENVVSMADRLGITTPLDAYPSAVLGTNSVNPLEMASAYGTLANDGIANPPYLVTQVTGPDGSVLYAHRSQPRRAVTPAVARTMDGVLQQVVDRGTGVLARIGRPVAGKTGTTDNWSDAWFIGATPQLVSAVWVGYPQAERPMVPPATPFSVTGGTWPAQIWQQYSAEALADQPVIDFPPPPPAAGSAIAGPQGLPVPDLVGLPYDQALQTLERAGFAASTQSVPSAEYPPGYVIAQQPAAGTSAPGGSTVTVTESQ
ncbi:MAG TPA: transglycosylase domain-containing protein [Acidimicrobiales bacterium]|nr:transglycosylase domain-containing protein [Acidimicrobiales bacterium]